MIYNVISLDAATSTENLQALEEVKDFCTTDLGRGGKERWTYHLLQEGEVNFELRRMSNPHSTRFVDSVTFQPCTTYASPNQDRYSVDEWNIHGEVWHFAAIYDGHCGHDTVNFVQKRLPELVKVSLQSLLHRSQSSALLDPGLVSEALSDAIRYLDDTICSELLKFLPSNQLEKSSELQLQSLIRRRGYEWEKISARCTQGCTVIFSLLDPQKNNLWIANLGDSQAILAKRRSSSDWKAAILNSLHNGDNPSELRRILQEHPGERECISGNRVVGYLAPTRAIGDTWLKVPSAYTRRAFGQHVPEWMSPSLVTEYARRILTPPYVSNIADVHHFALDNNQDSFLILCSDGLRDLYENGEEQFSEQDLANRWVKKIGPLLRHRHTAVSENLALHLLRDAIGGDDVTLASRNLTLEMDEKWLDDVTILVQRFR